MLYSITTNDGDPSIIFHYNSQKIIAFTFMCVWIMFSIILIFSPLTIINKILIISIIILIIFLTSLISLPKRIELIQQCNNIIINKTGPFFIKKNIIISPSRYNLLLFEKEMVTFRGGIFINLSKRKYSLTFKYIEGGDKKSLELTPTIPWGTGSSGLLTEDEMNSWC